MKAVVYDNHALALREMEKPVPGDNEVLVKIHAVTVNAADYRSMKMGIIPKRKVFGSDIAGQVEAVGKNICKFTVGDEVFGDISGCGFGGFAEYVAAPETPLALKPAAVSFEAAAAVPMAAVTALQAMRNKGNIQPGQKVLVCGAGGGVSTFAVQLAKYFGAEVTAVCGENNVKIVQALSADHVINYEEQDFTRSNIRYDLILAINGNHSLFTYRRLLAPKGTFVMVGGALSQVMKSLLFGKLLSIGFRKMKTLAAKPSSKDLEFLIRLVENGTVKPVIDRQYPLQETAEAMRFLGLGHAQGKVVIAVA
jgi:NADPH:quinone reductase-like Zn-dependent oxidoreductase